MMVYDLLHRWVPHHFDGAQRFLFYRWPIRAERYPTRWAAASPGIAPYVLLKVARLALQGADISHWPKQAVEFAQRVLLANRQAALDETLSLGPRIELKTVGRPPIYGSSMSDAERHMKRRLQRRIFDRLGGMFIGPALKFKIIGKVPPIPVLRKIADALPSLIAEAQPHLYAAEQQRLHRNKLKLTMPPSGEETHADTRRDPTFTPSLGKDGGAGTRR
jgi:hypothetical protein